MPEALHAELLLRGVVEPVALDGPEEQRWLDCDLASLAEHRLGASAPPSGLSDALRRDWQARATLERPMRLERRSHHERCYWILEEGERKGTIALANDSQGGRRLHLASFYVFPSMRGGGVGRRTMARLMETSARHDLGLRLDTSWSWQRTVRFYLGIGMWIHMWKRDLTFCWDPRTPPAHIEVGELTARLSVVHGEGEVVLAVAHRRGSELDFDEGIAGRTARSAEGLRVPAWNASSTLALALAMKGWPLIRSEEHREKSAFADAGPPEALAQRIEIWEAWERKNGWVVETPRIPGLSYPSWDELEARWEVERRAMLGPGAT